jgi:NADPH:quinone reductase-like Zn-dependent oxidoreductase
VVDELSRRPQRDRRVYRKCGKITDVLKLEKEYPIPIPSGRQILIRVHAIALNRTCIWPSLRRSVLFLLAAFSYKSFTKPLIPGIMKTQGIPEADFSGTIVSGNLQGTGLTVGQEVFGQVPGLQV